MSEQELQSFNARSQIGDVIVVRPDGWKWGSCECLPDFVVVKVKGTMEENKHLEESLTETQVDPTDALKTTSVMIKHRKNAITKESVDSVALAVKDFEDIAPFELTTAMAISEKALPIKVVK
jgi:hypothetical protein